MARGRQRQAHPVIYAILYPAYTVELRYIQLSIYIDSVVSDNLSTVPIDRTRCLPPLVSLGMNSEMW